MSWNNKLKFSRNVFNSKKVIQMFSHDYNLITKKVIKKLNSRAFNDINRLFIDSINDNIIYIMIKNKYYKPRKRNLLCRFNY